MSDGVPPIEDWRVRVGVWVERQGRAVLGDDRLELLEGIDRVHSISAAAREVGISYRHAWVLVQEINEAAGQPLVVASAGGRAGGGAQLTAQGQLAVRLCRDLQGRLQQAASGLLPGLVHTPGETVLRVAAAVSLEAVLGALAAGFAAGRPGERVRVVLGASDDLAELIRAGAGVDVFLTADPVQLDGLAAEAVVRADTVTPLAENALAVIGRADLTAPVRQAADLLQPAVGRVALAAPPCPLGGYSRAYLEGLGLYEGVLGRAVLVDHAQAVVGAVQGGQADAGLVYSTAAHGAGCRVLFRVARMPRAIRYAGAVLQQTRHLEPARRFLAYLASPEAARIFGGFGFVPLAAQGGG